MTLRGTGMTLVPLKVYLKNGFAKVLFGIAKGKHDYDKRWGLSNVVNKNVILNVLSRVLTVKTPII